MGNHRKSKIRLRLERKEEWLRHIFEVPTGIAVIKETTWSRPNAYVATTKKSTPAILSCNLKKKLRPGIKTANNKKGVMT